MKMAWPTHSIDKSREYPDTHRAAPGVFATSTVPYATAHSLEMKEIYKKTKENGVTHLQRI